MTGAVNASGDDLYRAPTQKMGVAGTSAWAKGSSASDRVLCAPPDLLAYVKQTTVREAERALALTRGTVHRLRNGYWPADARKIEQAWSRYKGRTTRPATSWFLRRVQADGTVRHGNHAYTSAALAGRLGELLAVARAADGSLLAQALELPLERFPLTRMEG